MSIIRRMRAARDQAMVSSYATSFELAGPDMDAFLAAKDSLAIDRQFCGCPVREVKGSSVCVAKDGGRHPLS